MDEVSPEEPTATGQEQTRVQSETVTIDTRTHIRSFLTSPAETARQQMMPDSMPNITSHGQLYDRPH